DPLGLDLHLGDLEAQRIAIALLVAAEARRRLHRRLGGLLHRRFRLFGVLLRRLARVHRSDLDVDVPHELAPPRLLADARRSARFKHSEQAGSDRQAGEPPDIQAGRPAPSRQKSPAIDVAQWWVWKCSL